MPVDFTPIIILVLGAAVPLGLVLLKCYRTGGILLLLEIALLAFYVWNAYAPGWKLEKAAKGGDPVAQFQLSRWDIFSSIAGQQIPNVPASIYWLKRSSQQDYPPAVYTLGWMYKYGRGLPGLSPTNPQSEKGQALINKALELGFNPLVPEDRYWDSVYAVLNLPIPPGSQWSKENNR